MTIPVETPRIKAIKASAEAFGRREFAHLIAYGTRYSVQDCERILQAAPRTLDPANLPGQSASPFPTSAGAPALAH